MSKIRIMELSPTLAVIFEIDAEHRRHLGDIGHPVGDRDVDWEKTQCRPVHNGLVIELAEKD
jgi:hypothetical protein